MAEENEVVHMVCMCTEDRKAKGTVEGKQWIDHLRIKVKTEGWKEEKRNCRPSFPPSIPPCGREV